MLLIKLIDARRGLHNKCVKLFSDQKIAEEIYRKLCDGVEDCETVEAEPKHGHWEYYGGVGNWNCSVCHNIVRKGVSALTPYCPNCGAKMDEVEE